MLGSSGKRPRRRATERLAQPGGRLVLALALLGSGIASAGEYEVCVDVTEDIRNVGSDDLFDSEPAADRLDALGAAAWPVLLRALEKEGPAVREGIVGVLASATDPDDTVRQGLGRVARSDPAEAVRAVAVPALRKLAGKESVEVVVAALGDPSPAVRREAITACTGICTSDAALERLVELALTDEPLPNALQARRVLWGLTSEGREAGIVEKIRAGAVAESEPGKGSGTESAERRALLAALLLAELGDDSRLDTVARAIRSDQPVALRIHAVHAIGRLGGVDRVPLVAKLQLEDPALAFYAHDALERMSERGIAAAAEPAASYTGPRAPQPLPRP